MNEQRPNIVLILSDDQGAWSLGCYGNKEVVTPNIDKLAAQGTRFENFFCTSPVCSPARASILTGKMPSQHGVLDWLGGGSAEKKDYDDIELNYKKAIPYLLNKPENPEKIPDDAKVSYKETINYQKYMGFEKGDIEFIEGHTCYSEILANNGYYCGLTGKWHLGASRKKQKGFHFWEVIAKGGTNYGLPEYFRDGKLVIENGYVTDLITDDALTFLDQAAQGDAPFYLSVHYTAPHDPWLKQEQPKEIWDMYNHCAFESLPLEPENKWQVMKRTHPTSEEQRRTYQQAYYTCITAMDQNIGRVMQKLEENNQAENTIIVFLADNGFNMGHHGIWGKGNGTFPVNMFETSVKVPCIVWGRNKVLQGQVCDTLVSQYDIFPTLLELAGCLNGEIKTYADTLPGKSFVGLLDGSCTQIRDDVVVYDEYGPTRMIRTGDYKLIYRNPFGPHELYNLKDDPDERKNLIEDSVYRPIKVALLQKLQCWFTHYTDPKYNGLLYPVDGEGQMSRLENYGTDEVVFRSF